MRASLSLGHGSGRGVFVAGLARVVAERTALTTMGVAAAHAPAEPSEGEHAERDPKDGADRAEYALHSRVVVPERVAEPGQESAPGGDSEGAIEGEDGEVHAGDPGGQRNERAKAGDEATEQHG